MNSLEKAIDTALDQMNEDALIKPFLIKNKAEVKIMCLTEYDEARTLAEERADGYEDGFEDGRDKGRVEGEITGKIKGKIEGVDNLISQFNFSLQDALKAMNLSESEYNELKKRAGMTVSEFESRVGAVK